MQCKLTVTLTLGKPYRGKFHLFSSNMDAEKQELLKRTLQSLHSVFGHNEFKSSLQREAVETIVKGSKVLHALCMSRI